MSRPTNTETDHTLIEMPDVTIYVKHPIIPGKLRRMLSRAFHAKASIIREPELLAPLLIHTAYRVSGGKHALVVRALHPSKPKPVVRWRYAFSFDTPIPRIKVTLGRRVDFNGPFFEWYGYVGKRVRRPLPKTVRLPERKREHSPLPSKVVTQEIPKHLADIGITNVNARRSRGKSP